MRITSKQAHWGSLAQCSLNTWSKEWPGCTHSTKRRSARKCAPATITWFGSTLFGAGGKAHVIWPPPTGVWAVWEGELKRYQGGSLKRYRPVGHTPTHVWHLEHAAGELGGLGPVKFIARPAHLHQGSAIRDWCATPVLATPNSRGATGVYVGNFLRSVGMPHACLPGPLSWAARARQIGRQG